MFSNKFDVEIVYVFKVGIIKITFNFLLMGVTTFFSNSWSQLFGKFFVVYIFPWIFIIFSIFFPTKIAKLKKFETKKTCWLGKGGGQSNYINPKFTQIKLCFLLQRKQRQKYILTSLKIYMLWFFFKVV